MVTRALNGNLVFQHNLLHSLSYPFENFDEKWPIKAIYGFNLPSNMFLPDAKMWNEMKGTVSCANIRTLFLFIAKVIDQIDQKNRQFGRIQNGTGTPRVIIVGEELVSDSGDREGLRIFIALVDSGIDLPEYFEDLIKDNITKNIERREKNIKFRPCDAYRKIETIEAFAGVVNSYKKVIKDSRLDGDEFVDLDDIHAPQNAIGGSRSPLNPLNILDIEYCITDCSLPRVCLEQMDINNYFNANQDGVGATTFKGFPKPERTYRIHSRYFTPETLWSSPLPWFLVENFKQRSTKLLADSRQYNIDMVAISTQAKRTIEVLGIANGRDPQELFEELKQRYDDDDGPRDEQEFAMFDILEQMAGLQCKILQVQDELKLLPQDNLVKLASKLGEGEGHTVLSGDALMREFAKSNDLIKLRLANEKRWSTIEDKMLKAETELSKLRKFYIRTNYNNHKDNYKNMRETYPEYKDGSHSDFLSYREYKQQAFDSYGTDYDEYKEKKLEIRDRFDYKRYDQIRWEMRERMCDETWEVLMTSDLVTPTTMNARIFFNGQTVENQFAHCPQVYKNLSIFGNSIVMMMRHLDKIKKVDTQFQLAIIMFFNVLSTYKFSHSKGSKETIPPNLWVTGISGGGKSFIALTITEMTFPGSILSASHITEQAWTGQGDNSDIHILCEEMPLNYMGISKEGKSQPIPPLLKAKISSQQLVTVSHHKLDDGTRTTKVSHSRSGGNMTGLSNEAMTDSRKGPLIQRGLNLVIEERKRTSVDRCDAKIDQAPEDMSIIHEKINHFYRMCHVMVFFWDAFITTGALEEIDTTEADFTTSLIFKSLEARGIAPPIHRHRCMSINLQRTAAMFNGIVSEFYSELGVHHRIDKETRLPKPFNHRSMLGLLKWGFISKEISICITSLLENVWVPINKSQVAKVCTKLVEWPPHPEKTKFMDTTDDSGRLGGKDYEYISMVAAYNGQIYSNIQAHMDSKVSLEDIRKLFMDMSEDLVMSTPKDFYDPNEYPRKLLEGEYYSLVNSVRDIAAIWRENKDNINKLSTTTGSDENDLRIRIQASQALCDKAEGDYEALLDELDGYYMSMCKVVEKEREAKNCPPRTYPCQDIGFYRTLLNLPADLAKYPPLDFSIDRTGPFVMKFDLTRTYSIEYYTEFAKLRESSLEIPKDPPGYARNMTLMNKPGERPRHIPVVKCDTDPMSKNNTKRRISVSVDYIGLNFNGIMKEAIYDLEHMNQPPRTYITGMPLTRVVPPINPKGGSNVQAPNSQTETLYHMLDVVDLKPKEGKILSISNKGCMDSLDAAMYSDYYGVQISEIETRVGSLLYHDSESIHCGNHWRRCGLSDTGNTALANPYNAQAVAWHVRTTEEHYENMQCSIFENYPKDYLKAIDDQREKLISLSSAEKKCELYLEGKYDYSDKLSSGKRKSFESFKEPDPKALINNKILMKSLTTKKRFRRGISGQQPSLAMRDISGQQPSLTRRGMIGQRHAVIREIEQDTREDAMVVDFEIAEADEAEADAAGFRMRTEETTINPNRRANTLPLRI